MTRGKSKAYVYHCPKSCGAQMQPDIDDTGLQFMNAANSMQKVWRVEAQKVAKKAVRAGTMIERFKQKGKEKGLSELAHRMVAEQRMDLVYGGGADEPCEPPPLTAQETKDLMHSTVGENGERVPALPQNSTLKKLVCLFTREPRLIRWTDETLHNQGKLDPCFVVLDAEALGAKWGGSKGGKQGFTGFHRALNMFSNFFIRSPLEEVPFSKLSLCNGQCFRR